MFLNELLLHKSMKTLLQVPFILFFSSQVFSQSWDVNVSGSVMDVEKNALAGVPVVLISDDDTIVRVITDSTGLYSFSIRFDTHGSYYLALDYGKDGMFHKVLLHEKGDTNRVNVFNVDLIRLRLIHDRFDVSAYYQFNETKKYENFDLEYCKQALMEYPEMCLLFRQSICSGEGPRTARRRMRHFKNALKKYGIDMKQIIFSDELIVLDTLYLDSETSRIDGVVNSMDGSCR